MTRPKRNAKPEEALHRAVAQYLDLVLPRDAFWFHTPSGGKRGEAEAGIFKAMGVKAGVPDICVIWAGRAHFIELKAKGRYFSHAQKTTMPLLETAGAKVWLYEARCIEDVETALAFWGLLKTKRVRVMA